MGGMLGGLSGFRKETEKASGIGRGFNLGQADIARDDGKDVIQVMRDAAGERPERLELARGQTFGLGFLPLAYVANKNRHTAIAGIGVNVVPNLAGRIARLELHGHLLRQDLLIIRLKNGADQFRKSFPKKASEQLVALSLHDRFGCGVYVGKFPLGIDRKKAVRRLLENV